LRSQVSQEINNRLMDELSSFTDKTPLSDLLDPHCDSRIRNGRRVRSLDISGKDRQLLQAISAPDFTVSGITNLALRKKLASTSWGAGRTDKQLSARVTRHLRLLRDHGLIRKVTNRHRYHLTDKGRQLTTALNSMLAASTDQLLNMAA
jgi:DNA-binding transcriptional ArsR family regulator